MYLRGAGRKVLSIRAGKLAKVSSDQAQLCMIQLISTMCNEVQWYFVEAKESQKTDTRLSSLLVELRELFEKPTQLPPSRGVFDHRMVLHQGTEPINKRPHRYPPIKKDVIETLVKQMLDQGIIQPSCSPYATPVVLESKKDGTWRLC